MSSDPAAAEKSHNKTQGSQIFHKPTFPCVVTACEGQTYRLPRPCSHGSETNNSTVRELSLQVCHDGAVANGSPSQKAGWRRSLATQLSPHPPVPAASGLPKVVCPCMCIRVHRSGKLTKGVTPVMQVLLIVTHVVCVCGGVA